MRTEAQSLVDGGDGFFFLSGQIVSDGKRQVGVYVAGVRCNRALVLNDRLIEPAMEQVQTCHGEASNAIIWISRESFRHEVAEMLVFSRRIGAQDSQPQQSERETGERRGVAGIEAQR